MANPSLKILYRILEILLKVFANSRIKPDKQKKQKVTHDFSGLLMEASEVNNHELSSKITTRSLNKISYFMKLTCVIRLYAHFIKTLSEPFPFQSMTKNLT